MCELFPQIIYDPFLEITKRIWPWLFPNNRRNNTKKFKIRYFCFNESEWYRWIHLMKIYRKNGEIFLKIFTILQCCTLIKIN